MKLICPHCGSSKSWEAKGKEMEVSKETLSCLIDGLLTAYENKPLTLNVRLSIGSGISLPNKLRTLKQLQESHAHYANACQTLLDIAAKNGVEPLWP